MKHLGNPDIVYLIAGIILSITPCQLRCPNYIDILNFHALCQNILTISKKFTSNLPYINQISLHDNYRLYTKHI